ncbi:MAG: hypothetical protein OMM_13169 [Candidatus Magnetoglobus multicellularis str. Araruama]|uniref:Uncharacterized protein n=1 Tax=Candidatus Magnetoglobus multicellularis str. Araruama TaxID=890399 RepID=A0A1V1NUB1_9BACT|nr:MAG: hypothetical protein OMM_13169 [Candidatus Magnetoglobus multicellularis str. Araruama]
MGLQKKVRNAAGKANSLELIEKTINNDFNRGHNPGDDEITVKALKSNYSPPWEMALQHWMDSITPGSRTYYRPSRRGANRKDIVLPGRKREGWILHIVLDTSGSMENEFSKILAIIASFCEK